MLKILYAGCLGLSPVV